MKLKYLAILISLSSNLAIAGKIHVAVASNFSITMKELVKDFKKISTHRVLVSTGSTGKLYAQITNGAPYDIFFSADQKRTQLLESKGHKPFIYAIGKLVIWSKHLEINSLKLNKLFLNSKFISMANPKLAPYGQAAKEALTNMQLWKSVKSKIVKGENISQTLNFVISGSAEVGLIAKAQLSKINGHSWEIPQKLYTPIKQAFIILKKSSAISEFAEYIKSNRAKKIIKASGYGVI